MSFLGMIPALLVLLALSAFTDSTLGRGVRKAGSGLWRLATSRHDPDTTDAESPARRRWVPLPRRIRQALGLDVGHVNPQVNGQGAWQGAPAGLPAGGPWQGQGGWPTGPVTMPLPEIATTGPVPTPVTRPATGIFVSGQSQGVRLAPGPQQTAAQAVAMAGDPMVAQRRAAVAAAMPHLHVVPHGEQGQAVAVLAAALGVDSRTVYRDIAACSGRR